MSLPAPGAVLFDLDGTLMDTAPDLHRALNRLLAAHARPPLALDAVRPYVSRGARGLVEQAFGTPADPQLTQALVDEYETAIAETTTLFEGMTDVLDLLDTRGIPWGVVSNKLEHLTRRVIAECRQTNHLRQCRVIVGGDTTPARKPDPQPLQHAANAMNIAAQRIWYIGDAATDIVAGRAAGMTTVAVDWGYLPPGEDVARWNADLRVDTVASLHAHLRGAA